jgi:hypothetical protein
MFCPTKVENEYSDPKKIASPPRRIKWSFPKRGELYTYIKFAIQPQYFCANMKLSIIY